jgi:hypothetical protein
MQQLHAAAKGRARLLQWRAFMDLLDMVTGILVVVVVIAAVLFPINRNHGDDDKKDD